MSKPNISTNPPPSGTPGQTTYTYLPASQEEKSKDSVGTLIGYYILKNSDKSIKLEMRYPGIVLLNKDSYFSLIDLKTVKKLSCTLAFDIR